MGRRVMRGTWMMVLAVLAVAPACGAEGEPLDQTLETEHYVFRFARGDVVNATWQEAYHAWLTSVLPVAVPGKVEYRKYRDRAHLQALTGEVTNGFADLTATRFHSIWPTDNHEVVHVLVIHSLGHPPALFNEGIAVAHSTNAPADDYVPRWSGESVHDLAAAASAEGRLPDLSHLLTSRGFFDFDTRLTYPVAGSFVRHLIKTRGLQPLVLLLAASHFDDDAATLEARFLEAYGETLAEAWLEWRTWLAAR